ncbi:unnamed protein product [Cylicostephanus goldi]|uniref:KATNIP domain-containing protein n=1 Tax=Cylicostephanus goldi TaxID=71465 RepID=A0A3P7N6D7_CYLGO|nr:unnamed protein product [Cylicostephanus goldi]
MRPLMRPTTHSVYGFIFQLQLLSSWGDEFYIGLNGIDLFDRRDERIKVGPHNLAAFPESVNILPSVEGDPRTSMNLIDDLAAFPESVNILPSVEGDPRTSMNLIDGCNDTQSMRNFLQVSVDDQIVYSGDVPASTPEKTGILEISFAST